MSKLERISVPKEKKFDLQELFFSITQDDSSIVSGNDTFIRISGYTRDEIIGQYHNVVRHPDMPRVIFKTLWDYIQADKPLAAYVKNMSKEGAYYWVLAMVFPLNNRYVSIRIKPNTQFFTVIQELYSKLLETERIHGIQESENLLLESLNKLGYCDYDHFMNEVLLAELLERKKLLLQDKSSEESHTELEHIAQSSINSLYGVSKNLLGKYEKWFEKIDSFMKIRSAFKEKSLILNALARDIVFLSLNASIASYKLETNGETFGVLASDVRANAKENDILIRNIDLISQQQSEILTEIIGFISYISLQIEMVTYFLKELIQEDSGELTESIEALYELVVIYNTKLAALPHLLEETLKKSISYLDTLEQQVMYLGYIQIYGIIESSRNNNEKLDFTEIFTQLKTLTLKISDEVVSMNTMAEGFYADNNLLIRDSKEIETILDRFKSEISSLKK